MWCGARRPKLALESVRDLAVSGRREQVPTGNSELLQKSKTPKQINDLLGPAIGRREWTRTIDPHHVKVVL